MSIHREVQTSDFIVLDLEKKPVVVDMSTWGEIKWSVIILKESQCYIEPLERKWNKNKIIFTRESLSQVASSEMIRMYWEVESSEEVEVLYKCGTLMSKVLVSRRQPVIWEAGPCGLLVC